MPRGRPRKPTALKALAGFPGRRPSNDDEPRPEVKAPKMPAWLDDEAKRIWRKLVRQLVDMRVLTRLDEGAMTSYCILASRMRRAEEGIAKSGLIIKDSKGRPMTSPYVKIANECITSMLRIATEFGLTPASRSKIHSQPEPASVDDTAEAAEAAERHARLFGRNAG